MRQILYNSASNILRLEFPTEWDGDSITGATVKITDLDGDELLAATALTLYTSTTLDGAVERFASSVVLDSAATALAPGDMILIAGAEGNETCVVKGYDATTYTAELEEILDNEYADADAVYGLWGTYTLDTTTVATWTAGLVVTLTWTPTGGGQPVTEAAQIAIASLDIAGLRLDLQDKFTRVYDAFTDPVDRFDRIAKQAIRDLKYRHEGTVDIDRAVDQPRFIRAVMAEMAYIWTLSGDEKIADEYQRIMTERDEANRILANPFWVDGNQDLEEDAGETTTHDETPVSGW
ncbi:MAG: hypothetical protein GY835_02575 [bacterium]|nr:hypothetical protein [bacterium]